VDVKKKRNNIEKPTTTGNSNGQLNLVPNLSFIFEMHKTNIVKKIIIIFDIFVYQQLMKLKPNNNTAPLSGVIINESNRHVK